MADDADAALVGVLAQAQAIGLLGKGPIREHITHARALGAAVATATDFVDLGSGGGIPGLVLAVDRPDLRGALVDGSTRRGIFLQGAVDDLGLTGRIEVVIDRAERLGRSPQRRGASSLVVARSFGPPAVLAECAAPLLAVGGRLIVSDPPAVPAAGERWPVAALAELGLKPVTHEAGPPAYSVFEQVTRCPDRYPRRVGIPAKRPLF